MTMKTRRPKIYGMQQKQITDISSCTSLGKIDILIEVQAKTKKIQWKKMKT